MSPSEAIPAIVDRRSLRTICSLVGRPVANRTELDGIFNIELKFSADPNDPTGVSVFTAVRE